MLRDTSESLQLELAKLRTHLAEAERSKRAKQEELARVQNERDAHATSLRLNEELLVKMQRERQALESQTSDEAARLRAEHDAAIQQQREALAQLATDYDAKNAQLAKLQQQHADQAHKLDEMTHTVLPGVFDKFTRDAADNKNKVRQLDAKYAQLSREMEARSAALNEEKNEFIDTFTKQCDNYKAMADALRDRSLKVDLSTILKSIGVCTDTDQEPAPEPQPEPTTPDDAASDKLKSLSLNWRRN